MLIQALAIAPILATCSWVASAFPVLLRRRYALPPHPANPHPAATGDPRLAGHVHPFFSPLQTTVTDIPVTPGVGHPLVPLADGRGNTHLMLAVPRTQTAGFAPHDIDAIVLMRFPDVVERQPRPCVPCLRCRPVDTVTTSVLIDRGQLHRLATQGVRQVRNSPAFSGTIRLAPWWSVVTPRPIRSALGTGSYMFMTRLGVDPISDMDRGAGYRGGYVISPFHLTANQIHDIRPYPLAPLTGISPPPNAHQTAVLGRDGQTLGYLNDRAVWGSHFVTSARGQDPAYLAARQRCLEQMQVPN
jgi:hypothetical protein